MTDQEFFERVDAALASYMLINDEQRNEDNAGFHRGSLTSVMRHLRPWNCGSQPGARRVYQIVWMGLHSSFY